MQTFNEKLLLTAMLATIMAGCSSDNAGTVVASNDADGDGILIYPHGTDLDDDADGFMSRLVGGSDVNDSNAGVGLTGMGTGIYENAMAYGGAEDDPEDMGVGDFNNDGYPDIYALESSKNSLVVHLNLGNRQFSSGIHYPLQDYTIDDRNSTVGDFNEDGNLDVVLVDDDPTQNENVSGTSGIHIVWGDGTGFFSSMTNVIADAAEYDTAQTVDFNEDGHLDIAVSDKTNDRITVIFGDGDGTFDDTLARVDLPIAAVLSDPVNEGIEAINIGDINGDGHMDLIALVEAETDNLHSINTFLGDGAGAFGSENVTALATYEHNGEDMAVGDYNADGNLDLIVCSDGDNNTPYLEYALYFSGSGDGTFTGETPVYTGGYSTEWAFNAGDLNGDGHLDAVVTENNEEDVNILLGKGDGTFKVGALVHSYDSEVAGVGIADFDGDGIVDISFYRDDTDYPTGLFIWYGLASAEASASESAKGAQAKVAQARQGMSNVIDLNRSSVTVDYSYTLSE